MKHSFNREKWADTGYQGHNRKYQVSNLGRVRSVDLISDDVKLMKGSTNKHGLKCVNYKNEKGCKTFYIHKEVAKIFLKKPGAEYTHVIHRGDDRKDNRAFNLKWITSTEHTRLQNELLKSNLPTTNPTAKLSSSKVRLIKKYILRGKTRKKIIAQRFGVSETQIRRIETGENWTHVEPAE